MRHFRRYLRLFAGGLQGFPGPFFNRHNFTNYAESRFGSLLVTNNFGMVGGRDDEDDDSYRTRIHLKLIGHSIPNEPTLRFELLQVSGIQDVVLDRAAGTYTRYVYGITPVASASLIAMVQEVLNKHTAYPLTGIAVNPDLVGITMATTLTLSPGATQTDKDTATGQALAAATEYINNLGVGESLVINEIADRVRNSSSLVIDIGEPNRQIEEILSLRKWPES
ncbi:MAG: baseplate J/gp47 family protein [Candidatus Solibacter sp.]